MEFEWDTDKSNANKEKHAEEKLYDKGKIS